MLKWKHRKQAQRTCLCAHLKKLLMKSKIATTSKPRLILSLVESFFFRRNFRFRILLYPFFLRIELYCYLNLTYTIISLTWFFCKYKVDFFSSFFDLTFVSLWYNIFRRSLMDGSLIGGGAYDVNCRREPHKTWKAKILSVYEALSLMIAFAILVLAIVNTRSKK